MKWKLSFDFQLHCWQLGMSVAVMDKGQYILIQIGVGPFMWSIERYQHDKPSSN